MNARCLPMLLCALWSLTAFAAGVRAQSIERLSLSASGQQFAGDAVTASAPAMSGDGKRVVFLSSLALDPADNDGTRSLYLWTEGAAGPTFLASAVPYQGAGPYSIDISEDGSLAAFFSAGSPVLYDLDAMALFVPGPQFGGFQFLDLDGVGARMATLSGQGQLWVNDVSSGLQVAIYNVSNLYSSVSRPFALSADGEWLAFWSYLPLAPQDVDGASPDLYVVRVGTTEFELVSRVSPSYPSLGSELPISYLWDEDFRRDSLPTCSLSADGRWIAFQSNDPSMSPDLDTNGSCDVLLYDRISSTTQRVSVSAAGFEGNGDSYAPSLSPDGRWLSFNSRASNLVPGDANLNIDVFRRDLQTGALERLSVDGYGYPLYYYNLAAAWGSALSSDGARVAFTSKRGSLVEADTNNGYDVFLWRVCASAQIVSLAPQSAVPGAAVALTLHFACVADGPAMLELGEASYPVTISAGECALLLPDLGAALAQDLVLDARLLVGGQTVATLPGAFTWLAAKIASVTPAAAPFDQNTGVVLELVGSQWSSGFGTAQFGDLPLQSALLYTSLGKSFAVTVAPAALQPGPVSLTLSFGAQTFFINRAFVYLGPGVSALSAISGPQLGGSLVSMELVDFAPGVPIDVYFGVTPTQGVPLGLLSSSNLDLISPASLIGGVVDLTLLQFAGQANEKLALLPQAFEYLPPQVLSLSKTKGAWYASESASAQTALFNAALPIEVLVGDDAPIAGSFSAADTVQFSLSNLTGAGPQPLRLRQAGIAALAPQPWTILPALSGSVAGNATSGGSLTLNVEAKAGGLVWLYVGFNDGQNALPIPGIHYQLDLSLAFPIVPVGVAGLGLSPTKVLPFGANVMSPGTPIDLQAFAWEAPLNYAFTNALVVVVP